jgi:hypothetical protein
MHASANRRLGAPVEAPALAKSGRQDRVSREERNVEWRPKAPVPFGLLPHSPGSRSGFDLAPRAWPFRPCDALADSV